MTHIQHLEDFAITAGPGVFKQFVADVAAGDYTLSIKFDGAPAVVFGNEGGKSFVATKGYFNKTPKKFFSKQEITREVKDPALALKLIAVYDAVVECYIPYGNVYWGDLLFWQRDSIEFQPNIVRYYTGGVGSDKDVGIAIHTQVCGTEPYHNSICRTTSPIWAPRTDIEVGLPNFEGDLPDVAQATADVREALGDDFFSRVANYNVRTIGEALLGYDWAEIYIHEHAVAKNIDPMKRIADKKLLDVAPRPVWKMIEALFRDAQDWKSKIYTECNLIAQREILATINKQFYHEGFVLQTPSATVKIVQRSIFSYANFHPDAERGWNKS